MPADPRKRQKKLERRKAKSKAKAHAVAVQQSLGISGRLARAVDAPIRHCCTTTALWEVGIASLLISRQLRGGDVVVVVFLVDRYCLGVKDVLVHVVPPGRYETDYYDKIVGDAKRVHLEPAAARKLIEGAVAYAGQHGLSPHPDYARAMAIFGDIDSASCDQSFEYGKDGKPFFFAGPNDGPQRGRQIIETLQNACGPDGFHYLVPLEIVENRRVIG